MSALPTDPPRRNGKRAPADDTIPTLSIVEQTMGEARRALALALMVCSFVIAALLAERAWFSVAIESVNARLALAQQQAGAIRLADQRLTDTAHLAVATGSAGCMSTTSISPS